MRCPLTLAACLAALLTGSALAQSAPPAAPSVQNFTPAQVAAVRASGETGGIVVASTDYRVLAARRDHAGEAEVHRRETDIFTVVSGRAIISIGGDVIGAHDTSPTEIRGVSISGGQDYVLEPGIILTIPANTPHWIREAEPGFQYNVVKVPVRD